MRASGRPVHHERLRGADPPRACPGEASLGPDTPRGQLAAALVDADPDAVVAATESGRICFANAAARALQGESPLRIVADRLVARDADDEARLSRALAAACAGCASTLILESSAGDVRIDFGPLGSAGLAMVRVIDAAARLERALAALTTRYGLTPSEASLARALAKGVLVPEHARRRGVAISTVRSQAQNLLRKTGAASQVDFLARLRAQAG